MESNRKLDNAIKHVQTSEHQIISEIIRMLRVKSERLDKLHSDFPKEEERYANDLNGKKSLTYSYCADLIAEVFYMEGIITGKIYSEENEELTEFLKPLQYRFNLSFSQATAKTNAEGNRWVFEVN